jgi:hypothetical protein
MRLWIPPDPPEHRHRVTHRNLDHPHRPQLHIGASGNYQVPVGVLTDAEGEWAASRIPEADLSLPRRIRRPEDRRQTRYIPRYYGRLRLRHRCQSSPFLAP